MRKRVFLVLILVVGLVIGTWFGFLGPVGGEGTKILALPDDTSKIIVAQKLREQGLVKSELAADLFLTKEKYPAGGYEIGPGANIWQTAKTMASGPQLLWVIVPPGWRKEQLAQKLQNKFGWGEQDLNDFLSFPEGEYFPDTYLVPRDESGKQVGQRMINNFNEKFAPYTAKFLTANIKNDTALKIASLLERESGGDDMPIISGIIWNRLLKGMQLKIDATVQYAKGKVQDQWWSRVSVANYSSVDSPYNTYLHSGLPPGPIASSGISAWEAVLNPAQTDCLYYLHDRFGQIHCGVTYDEHLANVEKFLK